jgi:chromosome segregation ATPase
MLVSLGFLLASLLALMLAPAYRARAVRLTTDRLKRLMPLTEEEIRADKDRVRTQYALRVHDLEKQLERAKLSGARQQVELNRRDARISGLEEEILQLKSDLEQHLNARRVLEQTIVDRVPAIEQRLAEAKALLYRRDRELAAVSGDTAKTVRALDEALQANAQQRAEIERLTAMVAARSVRPSLQLRSDAALPQPTDSAEDTEVGKAVNGSLPEGDAIKLPASTSLGVNGAGTTAIERLNETISEQAARIRQLEAALAVFEEGEAGKALSLKDSKLGMKSRIASLQAEVENQASTIQKLRAELVSANERLASQSAQFVEEMRKLGVTAGSSRRSASAPARRSLAERIGEAQPALASTPQPVNGPAATALIAVPSKSGDKANGEAPAASVTEPAAGTGARDNAATLSAGSAAAQPDAVQQAAEKSPEPKKTRLMDRIAGLTET